MNCLAHIAQDGRQQTVSEHLNGTAELCAGFAIAGHHGGLPDGGGQEDHWEDKTFCGRMKKAVLGKPEPYGAWQKEIRLPPAP